MSNSNFSSFCSDDLWDGELSWNAAKPRFTDCFLRTLPVYVPSFFLLICGATQLIYIFSTNSTKKFAKNKIKNVISFSTYNISKFVVVAGVVVESLVQLGLDVNYFKDESGDKNYQAVTWADLVYSIVNAVTFVSLLKLKKSTKFKFFKIICFYYLFTNLSRLFFFFSLRCIVVEVTTLVP